MARIDVNEIRGLFQVGETGDRKGNPVVALEVLGIPIAYAPMSVLDNGCDTEVWQDIFETRFARAMANLLLPGYEPEAWSTDSPTGREVYRLGPNED